MKIYCFNLKYLFAALFLLFAMENFAQDVRKLYIDPSQAYGGYVSEYFNEIEYIPLETTKKSLFGDIAEIAITDSSYVVFDMDTKCVLFFDLNGKYLTKVVESNDYAPSGVRFNKKDSMVFVSKSNPNNPRYKLETYTKKGRFVSEITMTEEISKQWYSVYFDQHYTAFPNLNPKLDNYGIKIKDPSYWWNSYYDNHYYKSLIPYIIKDNVALLKLGRMIPTRFIVPPMDNSQTFYFSTPLEHAVYKVNKDTAILKYQFIFPAANHVDSNLFSLKNVTTIDSIAKVGKWFNRATILLLSNLSITKDCIYFMTQRGSQGLRDPDGSFINRNFIYEINKGKLIALERMTSDASTSYLPFLEPEVISEKGISMVNGIFYTHVSSLKLFNAYEETKNKKPQYPPLLQKYFKTENRKSNPVIVKMKLKDKPM